MTDPEGPDEPLDPAHLGLEQISDLDEGLLSSNDAQAARDHLAGCDLCRADHEALAAVRQALESDAAELVMPDDVADRLLAALQAEPGYVPEVTAAVTTLPVQRRPAQSKTARKPVLSILGAAAAIAVLVFGATRL